MKKRFRSKNIDHTKMHLYEVLDEHQEFKGFLYSTRTGAILKARRINSKWKVTGRAIGKFKEAENRAKSTKPKERIYS